MIHESRYEALCLRAPDDVVRSAIAWLREDAEERGFEWEIKPTDASKKGKHAVEYKKEARNPFAFIVNKTKGLLFYLKESRCAEDHELDAFLRADTRFDFKQNPNYDLRESTVRLNTRQDAVDLMAAVFERRFERRS